MTAVVDITGDGDGVEAAREAQTRVELQQVRRAWSVLAMGSESAAHSLVALATGARSELVRAQASMAVLDRVGLGKVETHVVTSDLDRVRMADMDSGVGVGSGVSPVEILASRMRALGAGLPPVVAGQVEPDGPFPGDGEGGQWGDAQVSGDLAREAAGWDGPVVVDEDGVIVEPEGPVRERGEGTDGLEG
jgi:hypothetical protein